jgi:hypothetical protein
LSRKAIAASRDVGCHSDGDPTGAVDEQVRELRRQDGGLALGAVVVLLEVDRFLIEIVEKRFRDLLQATLGVTHRRRRVAVDRAEVALAVDQRQAHREILREADQRVVDRAVTVGVILAHHVADDAGGFLVRAVPVDAHFMHPVEDAAVNGLQAVAHVGQRAADDHAHGVIEIGTLHLVYDRDGADIAATGTFAARFVVVGIFVSQGWTLMLSAVVRAWNRALLIACRSQTSIDGLDISRNAPRSS